VTYEAAYSLQNLFSTDALLNWFVMREGNPQFGVKDFVTVKFQFTVNVWTNSFMEHRWFCWTLHAMLQRNFQRREIWKSPTHSLSSSSSYFFFHLATVSKQSVSMLYQHGGPQVSVFIYPKYPHHRFLRHRTATFLLLSYSPRLFLRAKGHCS
jgi:hypothetical protein